MEPRAISYSVAVSAGEADRNAFGSHCRLWRSDWQPNATNCSVANNACETDQCCEQACILSQELRRSYVELHAISYSVAIRACVKDRYCEQAWISLQELRRYRLEQNAINHNVAIGACEKARYFEHARAS